MAVVMQWDVKKVWQLCSDVRGKDQSDALEPMFTSQTSWEEGFVAEQAVSGIHNGNSLHGCCGNGEVETYSALGFIARDPHMVH